MDPLAPPARTYRPSGWHRSGALVLSAPLSVAAVAWFADRGSRGPLNAFDVAIGLSFMMAAAVMVAFYMRATARSLAVYEDWFHYRTLTTSVIARWDQVLGYRVASEHRYQIDLPERSITVGQGFGIDTELRRLLDEHAGPHILQRALSRIQGHKQIDLGRVSVDQFGVKLRRGPVARHVAFIDIRWHRVRDDRLELETRKGEEIHIPLARVVNPATLVELVARRGELFPHWDDDDEEDAA